jgi:hypothetical protein
LVYGRQKLLQTFPNHGVIVCNDRLHQPTTCIASADDGIMVSINFNQGLRSTNPFAGLANLVILQ